MASARSRLLGSERTQEGKAAVSEAPGPLLGTGQIPAYLPLHRTGPTHTESTCVAHASDTQPVMHTTLGVTVCMKFVP